MTRFVPSDPSIYIVDRGWHTEIALPVRELNRALTMVAQDFPGATYLTFGFGDRHYLMSRDTDVFDMVHALFPSDAAMLVTGVRSTLPQAFGATNVVRLRLRPRDLFPAEEFLAGYFEKSTNGGPVHLAQGPYPGSAFYGSGETYDAFHTCNTWVAETLQAGGLGVASTMVIFASQIMQQARALAVRQGDQS